MNTKQRQLLRGMTIGSAIAIALLGSGCLGVLQTISLNDDGRYAVDVKFTMSKSMLTAMDSMGGEPADTDEIFDLEDGPIDTENMKGLTSVVVEQLDNEIDVGIRISGILDDNYDIGPEDAPFVPFYGEGDSIVIGLPSLDEGNGEPSDPQSDAMAAMFFASTKYQLVLDKYIYADVSSAREMVGETAHPASVTELPGSWLVEFPFATWMQASEGCLVVVEL
jgi:hypothetical protein